MEEKDMNLKRKGKFKTIREVVSANTSPDLRMEEIRTYDIDFEGIISKIAGYDGKISVISDYDVDGVMSSLVLDLLLRTLHKNFEIYVPRRMSDGYGISEGILSKITGNLIITVDNGIAAIKPIQKAKEQQKEVIVLDHHLPMMKDGVAIYPPADEIMDLKAEKGNADFHDYCGAGIAYRLLCQMIESQEIQNQALCYAAIATIADMVPLRGDNRKIVKEGLKNLSNRIGVGEPLKYLLYKKYLTKVKEKDIAFTIAPILNAAGRLYNNGGQFVYEVLKKQDNYQKDVEELIEINEARKAVTKEFVQKAKEKISNLSLENCNPLILYLENTPEGILGLLAGALAKEYGCPAFVVTDAKKEGILKGSARTYGEIDLKREIMDPCSELLETYGGHKEAGGLSFFKENLNALCKKAESLSLERTEISNTYDLVISKQEDIPKYCEELEKYAPYGIGNPEPVFYMEHYDLIPRQNGCYDFFGKNKEHVQFFGKDNCAIGFFMAEKYRSLQFPTTISVVGNLVKKETAYAPSYQFELEDFSSAQRESKKTTFSMQLQQLAERRER